MRAAALMCRLRDASFTAGLALAAVACRTVAPAADGCFYLPAPVARCGGAALELENTPAAPSVDVCHRCLEDAHCAEKPGGRCVLAPGANPCEPARASCVYPGDACHPFSWTPCSTTP